MVRSGWGKPSISEWQVTQVTSFEPCVLYRKRIRADGQWQGFTAIQLHTKTLFIVTSQTGTIVNL